MMKSVLLVLALVCVVLGSYEGYKVVRANVETKEQWETIRSWELDVWSRDNVLVIGDNDIMVHADHIAQLEQLQVKYEVLINDIPTHLAEFQHDLETSRENSMFSDFFLAYHTYPEIQAFLANISATYSHIAKYVPSIGTTIQGRAIPAIVLTGTATDHKTSLFFSGGQHAREWVAPATVLYIINNLATLYDTDATVKELLDHTNLYFVPLVNPDGYVYTWATSNNRLWRKNRRANSGGSYGVDLNRNFDDHWGGDGSSGTPTSETYRGTAPFSEPESKAVADYVNSNGPFGGAIDYHSYSQLILRPYGWTSAAPPNEALGKSVGDTIRAKILAVNNVPYTSEPSWQLYYTAGTAQDWYYSEGKVPLAYTIELRDTGTYGFQLPASQIKPTGAENWAGFTYFVQAVLDNSQ